MNKKARYYMIWVEGLNPRDGKKVLSISNNRIEYTTLMSKALRVKARDLPDFVERLKPFVADWILDNLATYIPTEYAKKGTIWKTNGPRKRVRDTPPKKNPQGLTRVDAGVWSYYGCVIELRDDTPPDERYLITKGGQFLSHVRSFENAKSVCRENATYKFK